MKITLIINELILQTTSFYTHNDQYSQQNKLLKLVPDIF